MFDCYSFVCYYYLWWIGREFVDRVVVVSCQLLKIVGVLVGDDFVDIVDFGCVGSGVGCDVMECQWIGGVKLYLGGGIVFNVVFGVEVDCEFMFSGDDGVEKISFIGRRYLVVRRVVSDS